MNWSSAWISLLNNRSILEKLKHFKSLLKRALGPKTSEGTGSEPGASAWVGSGVNRRRKITQLSQGLCLLRIMKEKENTDAEEGRERMEWSVSLSHVVNLLGCTKEKLEAVKNNYAPPTSLKMLPKTSCRSLLSLSCASQFQFPKKDFGTHLEVFHWQ